MTREVAKQIISNIDKAYRNYTADEYEALEMAIQALSPKYWIDKDNKLYKIPDDIPTMIIQDPTIEPLEQKSGKWDRLYSWLNDMRLGIAPDETVTDIDERHCRESQTDILDEIMEWMIKAEVEPQESEDKK